MGKSPTSDQCAIYAALRTGPRRFTKIRDYTAEELDATIACIADEEGEKIYKLLNFVDAYFERRRRKEFGDGK